MIILDTIREDEALYGMTIEALPDGGIYNTKTGRHITQLRWTLRADCKKKDHVNLHGSKYHIAVYLAISDSHQELEDLRKLLESVQKAG